jgi:glutaredoxin-like YruB-family protein
MANIKIYSTPTCPWCKKAKAYLDGKGIKYESINVAGDLKAQEEMISKSGQMGVPVIDIDGHIVVGFDVKKIDELLAKDQPQAASK